MEPVNAFPLSFHLLNLHTSVVALLSAKHQNVLRTKKLLLYLSPPPFFPLAC